MTCLGMESHFQKLSVSCLINRGEGTVSREEGKQYPSAFLSNRVRVVQQHMIQVTLFDQGQCALLDFIELTIVLNSRTV